MKHVHIPFPTIWDGPQLAACRAAWKDRFEVAFGHMADDHVRWDFNYPGWLTDALSSMKRLTDGFFSSSDYPGALAAAELAEALELPRPDPARLLRASHKFCARQAMQSISPVKFALVDPDHPADPPFGYPCFVKPVKGTFSMHAHHVQDGSGLRAFMASAAVSDFRKQYVHMFNGQWAALVGDSIDGCYFIAEEPLSGAQVTVEGMVCRGRVTIFGVVDSELHPQKGSFTRFIYPTRLPAHACQAMHDMAGRAALALGLDNTLFNVEMFWSEADGARIIEFNPRMCGQFADLYLRVDGKSSYEAALEICTGQQPSWPRGQGRFKVAASVPLRVFEPARVVSAPSAADLKRAKGRFPDVLVWNEVKTGGVYSDFSDEDGSSLRYGVVNIAAQDDDELARRTQEVAKSLAYRFEKV